MRRTGAYIHSPASTAPPDMLSAGIDIIPDKKNNLGAKREKRGQCRTCGIQTHKRPLLGKKLRKEQPLTVEGEVFKGRCLNCHPLEGYIRRPDGATRNTISNDHQPEHQIPRRPNNNLARLAPQQPHYGGHSPQLRRSSQQATLTMPSGPPQQHYSRKVNTSVLQAAASQNRPYGRGSVPSHITPRHQQQHQQQLQHHIREETQTHPPTESGIAVPRTLEVNQWDDDVSVITMDYRLSQADRNSTAGIGGEVYPSDDEGDEMVPPLPNRRPGPDMGEGYVNEEAPPPRREPSHPGASEVAAPSRPSIGGAGGHRSSHVPQTRLPTISPEHGPELRREGSQMQADLQQNENGLDEDGYPVAKHDYGWDRQADLLPPGGMDMLLQNRSGELPLPDSRRQSASFYNSGEIRFQPLTEEVAVEYPPASQGGGEMPVPHAEQFPGTHEEVPSRGPRRIDSFESGPSFLPDDVSAYQVDSPGTPSQTRLTNQVSEPMYASAVSGARIGASLPLPPGLRASKTVGAAGLPNGIPGNNRFDIPGKRQDSKQTSDSGSQSTSTMAPPLVRHDRRGHPDDDVIQDPSTAMTMGRSLQNTNELAVGTIMDEEEDNEGAKTLASIRKNNYHSRPKGPSPSQDAAHMSPGEHERHPASNEPSSSGAPGHMYMGDRVVQRLADLPVPEAPLVHHDCTTPPSDCNEEQGHGYAEVARRDQVPTENVAAMARKLSLHNDEESQTVRPGAHAVGPQRQASLQDIPVIMHCLNLHQATANMREKALRTLAGILWEAGLKARDFVIEFKGVETMIKTMWGDMGNAQIQDAAADFLLALAASSDAKAHNDLLANEDTFCDSLLFAMQTHSSVTSIQLKGCAIFSCLASATSNNNKVSDGSLSGALMIVLSAMGNHPRNTEIQKAGLQALYYQCAVSVNAESNKRSLVESRLDNGSSGMTIISSAMQSPLQNDPMAMEWTCRLCWNLTSSEDLVKSISGTPGLLQGIIKIFQRSITSPSSCPLLEACSGIIGNLAHVENNPAELLRHDAMQTMIEAMRYHHQDFGVNIEACSAIANLAVSTHSRDIAIKAQGLETIIGAMQTFLASDEFVAESLRAMVCLAMHSQESKEAITVPDIIGLISEASTVHQEAIIVQEMCCKLLASLAVGRDTCDIIVDNGGLGLLLRALQSSQDEKVLDAACAAYRNLTCQMQEADPLLQKGALQSVIKAMACHANCASIQTNACYSIWNAAFKTQKEPGAVIGQRGVQAIVKAMQTHIESSELLEAACGALWSIIDGSIDRQKDVVRSGAIDAVVCTLVMHSTSTSTLIKACGVFSNISAENSLAEAVANAQGVSVVSEAMRSNASAINLMEVGCVTLRNIVYQFPEFAQEASMAISPIIDAMKQNMSATSFQAEACRLLWVLASEAENCQSKILALDGITVLMQCLQQNSKDAKVQEAALGAFNQLAASGKQ